jgi:hypothetical protein
MKLASSILVSSLFVMSSTGCASGPKYDLVADRIPAVPAHAGRIYFFRPSAMVGGMITADVHLNGEVVGSSKSGGFFFVDRAPGDYEVRTATEAENVLTFHLDENQTRYVQTMVTMGLLIGHIYPELVDADVGDKGVRASCYTGPELPAAAPKP